MRLAQATDLNKNAMISKLRSFPVGGQTNFYAGFEAAFDMLDASRTAELTSSCHTAILFLTATYLS
jgi:hypothetical protein